VGVQGTMGRKNLNQSVTQEEKSNSKERKNLCKIAQGEGKSRARTGWNEHGNEWINRQTQKNVC